MSKLHASGSPRSCRRGGCHAAAAVSLTFRYDTAQVWLVRLVPDPHPQRWDLCDHHAGTLVVPRGWELVDRRDDDAPAATTPAVAEAPEEVSSGTRTGPSIGRAPSSAVAVAPPAAGESRYAPLRRALPRLAAEYRARAAESGDAHGDFDWGGLGHA